MKSIIIELDGWQIKQWLEIDEERSNELENRDKEITHMKPRTREIE